MLPILMATDMCWTCFTPHQYPIGIYLHHSSNTEHNIFSAAPNVKAPRDNVKSMGSHEKRRQRIGNYVRVCVRACVCVCGQLSLLSRQEKPLQQAVSISDFRREKPPSYI